MDHGFIPLWVLVNILSFGTISIFYSFMYQSDQNNVGRKFSLRPAEMVSFLDVLTIFRNESAHAGRLYNFHSHKRIIKTPFHSRLTIPAGGSGNLQCGQNDLFAVTIVFRMMQKRKQFRAFINELQNLINELNNELHTISISDVLTAMGFPINW